jgi:SAM-dependent methyltransferase
MKLGVIPENLIERLLLAIKLVPTPIFDTQVAFMLARTVMAGTKLGIFKARAPGPLTAADIAAHCKTDSRATIKLLNALVGAGYLRAKRERYSVVHRVGNALTDDLGTEAWNLVFISQLAHHFDDATNRDLVRRAARALRPGGILAIQDVLLPTVGKDPELSLLADLYLSNTSQSGSRSFEEMADWQRAAGLVPRKPVRFRSLPGFGQQAAIRPAR